MPAFDRDIGPTVAGDLHHGPQSQGRGGHDFGLAAAVGALACPGRQVFSVNGDGAFGINAMELDTAVRHGAKAVFIVSNNAAWNIERYDQEANYGGRVVGTTLRHSDYAAMARALGAHGERVEDPAVERSAAPWRMRRRSSMSSPRKRRSPRTRERAWVSSPISRRSRPGMTRNADVDKSDSP